VLAASTAAHAAILVAFVGHPRSTAADTVDDRAAEIDLALDRPAQPLSDDDDGKNAPPPPSPAVRRTHTHPYPVPASHDWTPHDPALVHVPAPLSASPPHGDPSPATPLAPPPATAFDTLPRFTIPAGPGAPGHEGASHASEGHAPADLGGGDGEGSPAAEESVSTPARLLSGAPPAYPAAARSQGVEADVPLELVVSRAGAVESARVIGHAGFGFEQAALDAIRGYHFSPAVRDGRATRVRMRWTMQFRLR
jgi:protein TonB